MTRTRICRDCADFGPVCPNDGLPCGPIVAVGGSAGHHRRKSMMELEHMLTEDQCNKLATGVMDKLAEKYSDQYGPMPAMDLNPNIREHHTLRHALIRAAYMLGQMKTAAECAKICEELPTPNWDENSSYEVATLDCEAAIKAHYGITREKP